MLKDSLRIATGSQDGLMHIFQTVDPAATPIKFCSPNKDPINKLAWLNDNLIVVGTKTGKLHVWDSRLVQEAPVNSISLSDTNTDSIMDIEVHRISADRISVFVTCGRKIFLLSSNLIILSQFEMPMPLSFKEEGGASLHPDGSKFIAVTFTSFQLN